MTQEQFVRFVLLYIEKHGDEIDRQKATSFLSNLTEDEKNYVDRNPPTLPLAHDWKIVPGQPMNPPLSPPLAPPPASPLTLTPTPPRVAKDPPK